MPTPIIDLISVKAIAPEGNRQQRGYRRIEAVRAIGISRPTFNKYFEMALSLRDFRLESVKAKLINPRRPPVTAYQIWVVAKFVYVAQFLRRDREVAEWLEINQEKVSKQKYVEEQDGF